MIVVEHDEDAIRHADLPGPWRLAGESAAGSVPPTSLLGQGEAMRIFTGAPLPPGADTVMVQEDVAADGVEIRLTGDGPGDAGKHVRARASDFAQGDVLLAAGTRIGPAQIGLAALAGHASLTVHRQPRVTILSTGDELVPPGAPCPPGKLPASNGAMLSAMIEGAGGLVIAEQLVRDDLQALTGALQDAKAADVIVTSGGASVGALFLLPLVRRLAGGQDVLPKTGRARLGADVPPVGKRTLFMRAVLSEDGVATPLAFQDSGAMQAAAQANALIVRPAGAAAGQAGDETQVLDWAALGLGGA